MQFLADENLHIDIVRGLLKQLPDLDIIRVQDTEVYQRPDPEVLEWAAQQSRIVITHDVNTMTGYAYDRVINGFPMPGLIEVKEQLSVGKAIEDLYLLIGAGNSEDFKDQVRYVPLN